MRVKLTGYVLTTRLHHKITVQRETDEPLLNKATEYDMQTDIRIDIDAHAHTHTHTHTHARARARARTRTHAHACTHTHTRTHSHHSERILYRTHVRKRDMNM